MLCYGPSRVSCEMLGERNMLFNYYYFEWFFQLSKEYGSVFTLYFGTNKVVVLAGYETVREALVNYAEEFGERNISPILNDINRGHGKILYIVVY